MAHKSYTDTVCKVIRSSFLGKFLSETSVSEMLRGVTNTVLGAAAQQGDLSKILAADPARVRERDALTSRVATLDRFLAVLVRF